MSRVKATMTSPTGTPMRNFSALLSTLLLASALPLCAADSANAGVANDRVIAGGSVRQSEPVDGDMIGLGGNVDVMASVKGDALLGGGDVRVRDSVQQDLYAVGGNVQLDAAVGGNARLAGGNVEIAASASIGKNLSVAGGTVEVRGPIGGNVEIASGDVLIDSAIAGDVRVAAGDLELGPNAAIGGRLIHRGPGTIKRDPAAQVGGGIARSGHREKSVRESHDGRGFGWAWSLGLIALAGLITGLFPAGTRSMAAGLRNDPGIGLLLGFITLICVPIAAVILMVTVIGIPLAFAVLLLYFLMLIVGYAAVGVVVGDAALLRLRSRDSARIGWRVGAAMAAMLLLALLAKIPVVGGVLVFVALLAGVGAIVLAIRARTSAAPHPTPA